MLIESTFKITGWEEEPGSEPENEPKPTRVHVKKSFHSSIVSNVFVSLSEVFGRSMIGGFCYSMIGVSLGWIAGRCCYSMIGGSGRVWRVWSGDGQRAKRGTDHVGFDAVVPREAGTVAGASRSLASRQPACLPVS